MSSSASVSSCVADGSAPTASASPSPRTANRSSFSCVVCGVQFSDSHAAEAHKSSQKHKKKSGELEWEAQQYKKDTDVTLDDVWALVRRKQAELQVTPWSELQYREEERRA
ncbi:hypothetical protein LSCM1_06722 [Leishmania martiniquensis]|uniref:C2H2-type domain-containing protein n=1 Tax=Leishmania martiniquensis TaxID=1580590 RepID=A0A836HN53_9TRYP|nr:hypothetical protein LSCM1_06722 [Leishmania martiniquensis]